MIKLQEAGDAAFVSEALDLMPNFSDSLQTNSILTRRIMKLKSEKGFTISKEEASKISEVHSTDASMSSALTTVQAGIDSMSLSGKSNHKQPQIASLDSLLDIGGAKQSPLDMISSLVDLQPQSMLGGDDIKSNRFYLAHADRFSPSQTVKLGAQTFDMKTCSNGVQWKNLLPFSMRDGVVYSDESVEISCSIQIIKFLERIQLSFISKSMDTLSDLQAKVLPSPLNDALDIAVSPVKARADGVPEIIIMIMLKDPISTSPSLRVQFNRSMSGPATVEFKLPVFMNKFTEPVEMPPDAFSRTWEDITHNRPATFQKIDTLIKNPAPSSVPHAEVLKKLANFFQNSMNLKVFPATDTAVRAVGQVNFKPPNQASFPAGPGDIQKPIIAPVMVEAEFFKEDLSEFKLSFRSSDAKPVAAALINFLKFYIQPA